MSADRPGPARLALIVVLAAFYLAAGVLHLTAPGGFLKIMPPAIPYPRAVVAFTGACEVAGALGLLIPRTCGWAGRMLALYALCVWPANIYHALWGVHVPPLPDSWWYHGPRLAFQPVLIWAALFAGGEAGRPAPRRLSATAPAIPTPAPLIVFDGVCVLCAGFVRWVMARDRAGVFRFTPAQGPLGQALYRDLGLDTESFETNLLVVDGVAYGKFRGFVEIVGRLGGPWAMAGALRVMPAPLGDWLYDRIARNRYAMFGRRDACWLPTADPADRVI